jgi:hypothetical protein
MDLPCILIGHLVPVEVDNFSFSVMTTTAILPERDIMPQIEEELTAVYSDHELSDLVDLSPDAEARFANFVVAIARATQPPLDEIALALLDALAGLYAPAFLDEDDANIMLDDLALDAPFAVDPNHQAQGNAYAPSGTFN